MKTEKELYELQDMIDDFMGRDHRRVGSGHQWRSYHNDWNMLMPVVEKIEGLYSKAFPSNDEFIRRIMAKEDPIDDHYMNVIALPLATKIDEAHKAVVEFIKWYNSTFKMI